MLHEGTVGHNLDPFGAIKEETLMDVLGRCRLPVTMLSQKVSPRLLLWSVTRCALATSLLPPLRFLQTDRAHTNLLVDQHQRLTRSDTNSCDLAATERRLQSDGYRATVTERRL